MSGWFKLHRGWAESMDFAKEPFTEREAFLWLIEHAAYEPHTRYVNGAPLSLERGQVLASQRNLGDIWKWGRQRVRGFVAKLERLGSITQNSTHGLTILTVCNYGKYQDEQPADQPSSNPAATQQQPIKEEGKEGKEGKEYIPAVANDVPKRASRLLSDFALPEEWIAWAINERRWRRRDALEEGECFADYWRSQPGQKGVKTDWQATWRNWVRRSRREKQVLAI